jgi:hypothetical protein
MAISQISKKVNSSSMVALVEILILDILTDENPQHFLKLLHHLLLTVIFSLSGYLSFHFFSANF